MITIDGKRYGPSEVALIAMRVADARHKPGTETFPADCSICGAGCRIDAGHRDLSRRLDRPIVCLQCAAIHYPDVTVGRHARDGHVVTLGEALREGMIAIP